MHASATARTVFGLPVLHFVTDHAHQYVNIPISWSSASSFYAVNLEMCS